MQHRKNIRKRLRGRQNEKATYCRNEFEIYMYIRLQCYILYTYIIINRMLYVNYISVKLEKEKMNRHDIYPFRREETEWLQRNYLEKYSREFSRTRKT